MKDFNLNNNLRMKIITGSNSKLVQDNFTEWVTDITHKNNVIIKDIKCTECNDDYSIFIFYTIEREVDKNE